MNLKKNELLLRPIEIEDAKLLHELINSADIETKVVGWSYPVSLHNQIEWIKNNTKNQLRYVVDHCDIGIGVASINPIDFKNSVGNVNLKLLKDVQGKGLGTIVIKLLIEYGFYELNLNCITATILETNNKSLSLFYKLGFKKEGVLRKRVFKQGTYINLISVSLLKEEYSERNRE